MRPIGFVDANVLYPSTLRDVLIRLARHDLIQIRWSDTVLDEVFDNIAANNPTLDPAALTRTRQLMNRSIRDVLVTGYEQRIDEFELPDADDRHVLAAAVTADSQFIVTYNERDFPATVLEPLSITAVTPDQFLTPVAEDAPAMFLEVLDEIVAIYRHPPVSVPELIDRLRQRHGLVTTCEALTDR